MESQGLWTYAKKKQTEISMAFHTDYQPGKFGDYRGHKLMITFNNDCIWILLTAFKYILTSGHQMANSLHIYLV